MAETKEKATKPVEEEMIEVTIPRHSKDEGDCFVSINERTWLFKRGVRVKVPMCVFKALQNQEEMEAEIYAFEEANQK